MFELLEPRRLMAGHVQARLVDRDLVIRGDDESNGIEIQRIDNHTVKVLGSTVGEASTSINGQKNGSARFEVVDDVICYLYGGADDRLSINGIVQSQPATIRGDLLVYGGDGRDIISLKYVSVLGDAKFSLDDGNDRLTLRYVYVADDLTIYGSDQAARNDKTIDIRGNNYVGGVTEITLGSGADFVQVTRFSTGRLDIHLRDGDDDLIVDYVHAEGGILHGGAGIDTLQLTRLDFSQFPQVLGFNLFI
jgi:hypothetical protein